MLQGNVFGKSLEATGSYIDISFFFFTVFEIMIY